MHLLLYAASSLEVVVCEKIFQPIRAFSDQVVAILRLNAPDHNLGRGQHWTTR